jgi:uncharacterized protein
MTTVKQDGQDRGAPRLPPLLPAPAVTPEAAEFWDAAARGELLVPWCRSCTSHYWYPRPNCPHCGSGETELRRSPGTGTVYSVSVTRRAGPVPYAIAYVTLDEGVTMLTQIVDCDLDAIRIGDRVQVVFTATEGGPPVPVFRPLPP